MHPPRLPEDDRSIAIQKHPVLERELHGARQVLFCDEYRKAPDEPGLPALVGQRLDEVVAQLILIEWPVRQGLLAAA